MKLEDQIEIQYCLSKRMTFKAIAGRIVKNSTTVPKEVRLHAHASPIIHTAAGHYKQNTKHLAFGLMSEGEIFCLQDFFDSTAKTCKECEFLLPILLFAFLQVSKSLIEYRFFNLSYHGYMVEANRRYKRFSFVSAFLFASDF